MRMLVARIFLVLIVFSIVPPLVQDANALPPICSWIQGSGCNWRLQCDEWCGVDVYGTGDGWTMEIQCTSGDGGTWSGSGEWGGECPN